MILGLILAMAASASNQVQNSTLVGPEGITITAISIPSAVFQFGIGTTWCATTVTAPKLPFLVSYAGTPNTALCATDPASGVVKSIVAVQQSSSYTVTYTINGTSNTNGSPTAVTVTIPALPALPTYVTTCSTVVSSTGAISIILNASPKP